MQTAIDKIRELRALHEDGLLSRHEFDQRKNAILDAAHAPPAAVAASATARGTEVGLMAGQQVGPPNRRYRLERLIALGGMGQVWQATDLATHAELGHSAQVALKILSPELTESAGHARLLVQEATRARRLAHEHIVRVYDWARDPATSSYFVIMECLEGEDLDSLLARAGALPLARTLELLRPVAMALDYAWERHRLVHRDIKPGNVFVTARGDVKLLDFGIAARARAGGGRATEAPALSGTPGYRAPEAGAPGTVPSRALDVYSVAVMVHQMVSGSAAPAPGEPPRPEGLEDAQWQTLRSGFSQDPAARPQSVSALLDLLEAAPVQAAQEAPQEAQPPVEVPDEAPVAEAAPAPDPAVQQAMDTADRSRGAAAEAAAQLVRQRLREQQKRERAEAEAARRARREALREQLAARRDEEVAKTRQAQDEAQRKALQAKAAAAYLAEQERARSQPAPSAPAPQAAAPVAAAPPTLLRDAFQGGGGAGPELVVLRAGRFQMGSPEHERKIAMLCGAQKNWLARETPQHWVGIERPFAMGRYPVTVGEWRVFVEATGWQPSGEVDWSAPGFPQTDDHPVVGVTWGDAQQYVAWLGERTGQRYRLPSEAEWEYACRAGTKTAFSFGDAIDTSLANYDGNFTWNGGARGEYRRGTTPVTQFAPNPWGLHDMHGNVWEWVQDVMHDSYEGAPLDGSAWEEGGERARRILRGGSWLYNPRYLRSALRNGFSAVMANDIVGLRVVRELPAEPDAAQVS
jgi:formylglycine-generating enzyme required for sulfatase activity